MMATIIGTPLFAAIVCILLPFPGCRGQVPIDDIDRPPPVTGADSVLAGAFRLLDGEWEGRFTIYEYRGGPQGFEPRPEIGSGFRFSDTLFELHNDIDVHQTYESHSPFFQRVTIVDTYASPDGEKREVVSQGVNKIQDGTLWCVVRKPDETVIHQGRLEGDDTIIWQRDERDPLRVEYFREQVLDSSYTILGWGYYPGDDLDGPPRLWFRGAYKRR